MACVADKFVFINALELLVGNEKTISYIMTRYVAAERLSRKGVSEAVARQLLVEALVMGHPGTKPSQARELLDDLLVSRDVPMTMVTDKVTGADYYRAYRKMEVKKHRSARTMG